MCFHLRVLQSTLIPHYIDFITSFVQYWYHLRLIRLYCCIVVFVVSYTLYSYCSHWIILMFVFSSYSSSPHPVQFVHFHIAPSSSSTISKLVNFFLYFHLSSSSTSQSVVCAKPNLLLAPRSTTRLLHSSEASQESFKAFHKALKLSHISLKLSISMGFSNSTGAHRHSKKNRRHHWLDQHGPQHQHYQQHQRLDQHQHQQLSASAIASASALTSASARGLIML